MDDLLTAMPLCGLQVQRAYALVGLMHPRVTAKQWATFVRRYARSPRQPRGLIGIQDGRGYVHGVFCYAVDQSSLDRGRILQLENIILAHLPGQTLGLALITCAEHLATEFGCSAISVDMPATTSNAPRDGSTQTMLQSAGFRISEVKMRRTHAAARTNSMAHSRPLERGADWHAAGGPFRPGPANQPCLATVPV
jgi:hypothetical protein